MVELRHVSLRPSLTSQMLDKPGSTSLDFGLAVGLCRLVFLFSGTPLFPALADSFTGLRVLITLSLVVVVVLSTLFS